MDSNHFFTPLTHMTQKVILYLWDSITKHTKITQKPDTNDIP